MDWFKSIHPVLQALLATCFTWAMTAIGAAVVLVFKSFNRKLLDGMLGFAAGVMIAASFWSLLEPAIQMSQGGILPVWVPAVVGFIVGGLFLWLVDKVLPHLHPGLPISQAEGIKTSLERSILLVLAITLHNIPEGMAIGVAFGAVGAGVDSASISGAIALTLGIGIQNLPEGTAVSVPLRREGFGRFKSLWYGQLSGIVEPISAVLAAAAVVTIRPILPYALAFAAGAMIYVVVEELIPESQLQQNTHIATWGAMLGFAVMMLLDVALG
ncbi:MAG: ZIP family metal transporter [Sedimentisphaerales bacterium]|nr:ZIP family metal transporter [Sedimentisphaerales bacterium]